MQQTGTRTARAALVMSTLSLCAAVWTGCRDGEREAPRSTPAAVTPTRVSSVSPSDGTRGAPVENAATAALTSSDEPSTVEEPSLQPASPEKTVGGDSGQFNVRRIVVTTGIENREPVAISEFRAGSEPIFAFMELSNESDTSRSVHVTFEHADGKTVGHVDLEVPPNTSRWRTWAKSSLIRETGKWTAVVRTAEGSELARSAFVVDEA